MHLPPQPPALSLLIKSIELFCPVSPFKTPPLRPTHHWPEVGHGGEEGQGLPSLADSGSHCMAGDLCFFISAKGDT